MKKIISLIGVLIMFSVALLPLYSMNLSEVSATSEGVTGTGQAIETGFGGDIELKVTLENGEIVDIETVNSETEGLGKTAIEKLTEQVLDQQSIEVDVITGATFSSEAFLTALAAAIENAGGNSADYKGKVDKESTDKSDETKETQVVVIGAGGARFAAAISAKQCGADVIHINSCGT